MGATVTKPLSEISKEELASRVEQLGEKFVPYAEAILENGVDGELLDGFTEEEFAETLQDLEVKRLHQRVLTKEWKALRKKTAAQSMADHNSQPTMDMRESAAPKAMQAMREMISNERPELIRNKKGDIPMSKDEVNRLLEAVAEYELSEDTESCELECFDRLTDAILKSTNSLYAGIHLLDADGHLSLSSRSYNSGDTSASPNTKRFHMPKEASACYEVLLTEEKEFVKREVGKGFPCNHPDRESKYFTHAIKNKHGVPIGTVCIVVDHEEEKQDVEEELREAAAEAQSQLELRKVLLDRNKKLTEQIQASKAAQTNIILPAFGPLEAVTQSDVENREKSPFYGPQHTGAKRSALLPVFNDEDHMAKPEHLHHLPDDFWAVADAFGVAHPPIHKRDMERVAAVEAVGVKDIPYDDPAGKALKRLTDLAARLFDLDYVEISILDHKDNYNLATHTSLSPENQATVDNYKPVISTDKNGNGWLCSASRGPAICNYVAYCRQTFTIHDVWADESFAWVRELSAFRFYSSSPIFVNGEVVASLCLVDFKRPHPEYSPAHELQAEQIAQMAAQHIENWSLRREMERLERVRQKSETPNEKNSAPEGSSVAVVFTDVQGSTSLWEADSDAMHEALLLHDKTMRRCIAANHGFEVTTEGDAFHVAFHDAVDAVLFAVQVQQFMHDAPWDDAILALPDAKDDGEGFRGLRVRIAIHCGDVTCRDNEVSSRREYTGPTVNISKSLEHMAHGGQILVSSDCWNGASYLADTKLGSPQVVDLGSHVLLTGKKKSEGVVAKGVLQLVPTSLAFDYSRSRTLKECESGNDVVHHGRQFPEVETMRQLSASFHDAPYLGNVVSMMFVYTSEIEKLYDDTSVILAALVKHIGGMLQLDCGGYQCKPFMLAFSSTSDAVSFGLALQEHLAKQLVESVNMNGLVQVGIHRGQFTSMGPHQSTGRADYYGKVVNRAARVAGAAEPGRVYLGLSVDDEPEFMDGLDASFVGLRMLKGVQEEMALYACRRDAKVQ